MATKILAIPYIVIYGALLVLSVAVTFTTNVGFWGIVGIGLFGWLTWRHVRILLAPSDAGGDAGDPS